MVLFVVSWNAHVLLVDGFSYWGVLAEDWSVVFGGTAEEVFEFCFSLKLSEWQRRHLWNEILIYAKIFSKIIFQESQNVLLRVFQSKLWIELSDQSRIWILRRRKLRIHKFWLKFSHFPSFQRLKPLPSFSPNKKSGSRGCKNAVAFPLYSPKFINK